MNFFKKKKKIKIRHLHHNEGGSKAVFTMLRSYLKTRTQCAYVYVDKRTVGQKKKKKTKHPYLLQCKLSYRNETGSNHHGWLSISIWCFKIFLRVHLYGGMCLPNFNFSNISPKIWQRNRVVHNWKCLYTNFHNISYINLRVITGRNYN